MSDSVHIGARGRVAILAVDNPPVNAPTPDVRRALFDAVAAADVDPEIGAIVLRGNGRSFGAGAELLAAQDIPTLSTLCARIESCTKPVVAALHGLTLTNGAELALAAHYRGASRNLRSGWSELQLGLIPSGGATQRLPRLIGASSALDVFLSARPIPANRAKAMGLVDTIERGDIVEAAVRFANAMIAAGTGPRRAPLPARRERRCVWRGAIRLATIPRLSAPHPRSRRSGRSSVLPRAIGPIDNRFRGRRG